MATTAVNEVSDLDALTDAQFECKFAGRHLMRIVEVEHFIRPRSIGYRVIFHCDECGRFRNDIISPLTGDLLARWYPPDNFYKWVGDRIRINDLRLAKLERMGIPVGQHNKTGADGDVVKAKRVAKKPSAKRRSLTAV